MHKITFFFLALIFLGIGCGKPAQTLPLNPLPQSPMLERVTFQMDDGVAIVGDWYTVGGAQSAILLLHMMPSDRASWRDFAEVLLRNKINALAIDLRGHGESIHKFKTQSEKLKTNDVFEILDYKKFTDTEHQASSRDVEAALAFLQTKGFSLGKISVGGASIGANLAAQAMAAHPEIKKGFLLSPGLDFRGVKTPAAMQNLHADQSALMVSARDDTYSFDTNNTLEKLGSAQKKVIRYDSGGHGTNLFSSHSDLTQEIIDWMK